MATATIAGNVLPPPEAILDLSQPFDENKVRLLETLAEKLYSGQPNERELAHNILKQFEANEESWRVVGSILERTKHPGTVYIALSILEACIKRRWLTLPPDQRAGIKEYVTNFTVRLATEASSENKFNVNKVNRTLVQIVKHEWPEQWPTFISDICRAARASSALCLNALNILTLLSEEVFDFNDELTTRKIASLKATLTSEFQTIYELCVFVLKAAIDSPGSVPPELLKSALDCLSKFVKHIPEMYVCDELLLEALMQRLWPIAAYRIHVVRCLLEIASLQNISPDGLEKLRRCLWTPLALRISELTEITMEGEGPGATRLYWEAFYSTLALCLNALIRNHRTTICEADNPSGMLTVLNFLVTLTSKIPHDETFKILVDFWDFFSESLLVEVTAAAAASRNTGAPLMLDMPITDSAEPSAAGINLPLEEPEKYSERLRLYQPILNGARRALILRMARPQEVLIKYDEESGTVEREYEIDTDEVTLYNSMRATLVYLTNLGGSETEAEMLRLLQQVSADAHAAKWNPQNLNRLCWAIGSISGAMSPARERSFLVKVVKDLLSLCEHKRGKENKAIVASMIMYTFGQYPRFLRTYVRFLETVIGKLFEFMGDTFPGVQDMACETFAKIALKCDATIATGVASNKSTLAAVVLNATASTYVALQTPKQQLLLVEADGYIIDAAPTVNERQALLDTLMSPFNAEFNRLLMLVATGSPEICELAFTRRLTEVLRVNERVAYSAKKAYATRFAAQYEQYLHVYKYYSTALRTLPETTPAHALKAVRAVKRSVLLLFTTVLAGFAENPAHRAVALQTVMPAVLEPVLTDYRASPDKYKDHEVLSLLTTLYAKYSADFTPMTVTIFALVFDCTLDMIKGDFHSYPDHRTKFYEFLNEFLAEGFNGLLALPDAQKRLFVESLVWAFQHEQPTIADQGLKITNSLIQKLMESDQSVLTTFCRAFYWPIFAALVEVLTDTLHKSGFDLQCLILMRLIQMIEAGKINEPENFLTKNDALNRLGAMLLANFKNLKQIQIEAFAISLFNLSCGNPKSFRQHVRDFLVTLHEFGGDEELYKTEREEAVREAQLLAEQRKSQIPGFIPQYDYARPPDDDDLLS